MAVRPLDPSNIRELVNARDDGDAIAPRAAERAEAPRGAAEESSTEESVETARASSGFRYEGNAVDAMATSVPMLLLGQKRTSKDKFYDLLRLSLMRT